MTSDEVATFIGSHFTGVFATLGSDGRPHLTTVIYAPYENSVVFVTYRKSQKLVNVERDPRVSFLIESYGGGYQDIQGVSLSGTVEILDGRGAVNDVLDRIRAHRARFHWATTPTDSADTIAAKRVAVTLRVDRVQSQDHSKLAGIH
jgi:PPOX class probable F420-dependent enzyme